MSTTELKAELSRQLRTSQDKLDYWLMAVAASAIALAVHNTRDASLGWEHVPLGVAVLAWSTSFFAGYRRQIWIHASLYANYDRVRIQEGTHPLTGDDPQRANLALEEVDRAFFKQGAKATSWAHMQFGALVAGAVLYIGWHVLMMYLRTVAVSAQAS